MKNNLNIEIVNPKELTEKDFEKINEVTQDMWAEWLWELVQCKCCNKMLSKKDVFGHLEKNIYEETVEKIMKTLNMETINCTECGEETKFIYWRENVINIKERLLQSEDSFLVLCKDEKNEIIWYEDWYVSSVDEIFKRELEYHYKNIWVWEIKSRVSNILWTTPEKMIVISSLWLISKYVNFYTAFEIMNNFYNAIPEKYEDLACIAEVDLNNNISNVTQILWWVSLWIQNDENLKGKIENTSKEYKSNLTLIPNALWRYKKLKEKWIRHLVKLARAS